MRPPIYEPKGSAKEYGDLALNIYTGCPHRCYYCVGLKTPVLTDDMRSIPIDEVRIGDKIIGVELDGKYHKFTTATVLNKFYSVRHAYLIKLADGTEIVCSGDHRWLTERRGWKYTFGKMAGPDRRPYLTTNNSLIGYGRAICNETPQVTDDYKRGYLYGIISGDGTIGHYEYSGEKIHGFRLAMQEECAINRAKLFLSDFGVETHEFMFRNPNGTEIPAIRAAGEKVSKIERIINPKSSYLNDEYLRGYLAGFYDAEGSSDGSCRAYNSNEKLLEMYEAGLDRFKFSHCREDYKQGKNKNVQAVRFTGGLSEAIRFLQLTDAAIHKKVRLDSASIKTAIDTRVVSVEDTGEDIEMVDITTTTGNFIAGGYVAHNCFAPGVLHKDRETFHSHVEPRPGIVEEVRKQLEKEQITGKLIHLCFTCDPYPTGYDTSVTREIIKLLKEHGNHVQILTKGDGRRDFDLLDGDDWYGVTIDGQHEWDMYFGILNALREAKKRGIHTWVSFEPVLDSRNVLEIIETCHIDFDKVKIGKLNYHPSEINWKQFGIEAEALCRKLGLDYYIKDSLRAEMERQHV